MSEPRKPLISLDDALASLLAQIVPLRRPLDPLAPVVTESTLGTSDRSFLIVLSYETDAGSRSVPLGGRPLEGGGRIEGIVYFDANASGTQDASETGVPGASVEARYAVVHFMFCGKQQNGHANSTRTSFATYGHAIGKRHHDIHHHGIGWCFSDEVQRGCSVVHHAHAVSLELQHALHGRAHRWVIFGDENMGRAGRGHM